jgi:UPF0271 protein
MTQNIDINSDVGEGIGNESQLMPYISSCNIACGGHAGNEETMKSAVQLAKKYKVKIGAHPSFPDKENFGRKVMEMPCVVLYKSIKVQVEDLMSILKEEHLALHHVKPHGALYNLAVTDERVANVIVEVMKSLGLLIKLYVPFGSKIADIAIENNVPITYEAFADRNYNTDLTLVSRQEKEALIEDEDVMFEHVFRMYTHGKVKVISGQEIPIKADTFCIHGDSPNAVNLIKNLKTRFEAQDINVR